MLRTVPDTSHYIDSFAPGAIPGQVQYPYLYGEQVESYREEPVAKLVTSNAAGLASRIGDSFQENKRIIISGNIDEQDGYPDDVPLRTLIQKFRYAHRAETGVGRLYMNSAADGRPAEYHVAAVESVSGLKYDAPINNTPFEVAFLCEPEIWFDAVLSATFAGRAVIGGGDVQYTATIQYQGYDVDFPADAEGLPAFLFAVTGTDPDFALNLSDPAFIRITNAVTPTGYGEPTEPFTVYVNTDGNYHVDSYKQGIRYGGASFAAGALYEYANYEEFPVFPGTRFVPGGILQTLTVTCHKCDLVHSGSTATGSTVFVSPRHW